MLPRSQKLMKQLGKGSAYLESLPISFKEQLQRQKEHGHPWHVLGLCPDEAISGKGS